MKKIIFFPQRIKKGLKVRGLNKKDLISGKSKRKVLNLKSKEGKGESLKRNFIETCDTLMRKIQKINEIGISQWRKREIEKD